MYHLSSHPPMKHQPLLLTLLLALLSTAALADTPVKISEDYQKQSAAALGKLNETLEKATTPLIAALIKSGDTVGAGQLTEQFKAKTAGEPVPTPHPSATLLFAQYDQARIKALEPAQKAAVSRIDAMLSGREGKDLATITELGKVREEIELDHFSAPASAMQEAWTTHMVEKPGGAVYGEMYFKPDGAFVLLESGQNKKPRNGHWKSNRKGDKVTIKMDDLEGDAAVWQMQITGTTATLDRDVGRRYMRVKER